MAITRRELFSIIAKTGVPAAVAITVGTEALRAETIPVPSAAVGLLYDASVCIGCKACVAACAEANDTPPDTRGDALHQAPSDLNDLTRNVIKLYKSEDGSAYSFVKRQCMHCLDPACAAGCPFQALHKDPETGVVTWEAE
ncbi:MAG TPA: 4Fe-4S dicluster domain-containing protein, partial [Terracidiphilus sp.]